MSEEVRDDVPVEPPAPPPERPGQPGGTDRPEPRPGSAAAPTRLEAFVTGGAYGVLAVAGAVIALLGSFYHGFGVGPIPVSAIAFVLLNLGAFRLAGWAMGTRLGAVAPAAAWLLVVIFLSSRRAEGDLVISATAGGYVYILGGSIAAVLAIVRTRSTTSWL
ncbi:MAG TPA: DUF6113 family protein [Streptosporangiaceae bacterium]|nr:DUF6113 family protein [Streptosporangiaceae bacterium]